MSEMRKFQNKRCIAAGTLAKIVQIFGAECRIRKRVARRRGYDEREPLAAALHTAESVRSGQETGTKEAMS